MNRPVITSSDISNARALLVKFDAAVLAGDSAAAHDAHMAYDGLVNSLNGGTKMGSYADDESPGILLQNALIAKPGETPMWGQHGTFLIQVGESSAYIEYQPTFFMHAMYFYAVRQVPFISDSGYKAHFLSDKPAKTYPGKSVREVAIELFQSELKKSGQPVYPKKLYDEHAELPFVIQQLGDPLAEIGVQCHVLIKATNQVGIVVEIENELRKLRKYIVATLSNSKTSPKIVHHTCQYRDIRPLDAEQLAIQDHPGKYLTWETVKAMRSIKTAERLL